MKHLEKKSIINLENRLIYDLKKYREYELDMTIPDDDFSTQLLLNKVLYSFDCYKRGCLNKKINSIHNLEILENQVNEVNNNLSKDMIEKLVEFFGQYFSKIRLKTMFIKLEESTINSISIDSKNDQNIDLIMGISQIVDNLNMASNDETTCYNSIGEHFTFYFKDFKNILTKNQFLLNYYHQDIKNLSNSFLIPNDKLNGWWYQIHPIKQKTLEFAISTHYSKETENAYLSEIILQIENDSEIMFDEFKNGIQNAINWGRNQIGHLDEIFEEFLVSPKVAPSFSTWSDEETPKQSDHAVSAKIMQQSLLINKQVMKDLIRIAKSEPDLSENERNNIIATAHLMLGERDEAMKLLKG